MSEVQSKNDLKKAAKKHTKTVVLKVLQTNPAAVALWRSAKMGRLDVDLNENGELHFSFGGETFVARTVKLG